MDPKILTFMLIIIIGNLIGGKVVANDCPEHWLDGSHVDMGCLLINRTIEFNWDDANKYCQYAHNASLVEIHIPEQMEYLSMVLNIIAEYIGPAKYWTGGTDKGREG